VIYFEPLYTLFSPVRFPHLKLQDGGGHYLKKCKRGDIADVITHGKFYVNRFSGSEFWVLTPPILTILPLFIGLAGRPNNSVSITVLHCDVVRLVTGIIARSVKRRYFSYSEGYFEVFRPTCDGRPAE